MNHDFFEVVKFLQQIRSRGAYGSTEIVWKGHDIVHIKHTDGFKPGELPGQTGVKQST